MHGGDLRQARRYSRTSLGTARPAGARVPPAGDRRSGRRSAREKTRAGHERSRGRPRAASPFPGADGPVSRGVGVAARDERAKGGLSVCVDIGGTFTDAVLMDGEGAVLASEKVFTTSGDLSSGAVEGVRRLLAGSGVEPAAVGEVVHATTQTSNTMIERTGARTALVTTAGFRDVLELGRESRYDVYDLFIELPRPLVPRRLRLEAGERLAADGRAVRPPDPAHIRALARRLAEEEVEAVAVCLLHAYRNPAHERAVRGHLRDGGFEGPIVLSSDVCPEIREYERTATTVANAYLFPRIAAYLRTFEQRLAEEGVDAPLSLFSSYGGRLTAAAAERRPVEMLECGAAAGVLTAAATARQVGWPRALSFDMGGTTAKAAIVRDGRPRLTRSYEVARLARFMPGSGLPVAASAVDLIEIGAGGGSIAAVDALGLVAVGPESAGSEPGPACYGRGGRRPTVADADLVLGYLGAGAAAGEGEGGGLRLDTDLAREAVGREVAGPLGRSVEDAAMAIHDVVVEQMARAARLHAVAHGEDPRRLRIVAFGGAGPVHACALARRLGAPEVLVMPGAGVGAAVGLGLAPAVCVVARSRLCPLEEVDWPAAEALVAELRAEALRDMGLPEEEEARVEAAVSVDMRYRGQGYEVNVPFRGPPYGAGAGTALDAAFAAAYREHYGRDNPGAAAEVVSWRLEVRSGGLRAPRAAAADAGAGSGEGRSAPSAHSGPSDPSAPSGSVSAGPDPDPAPAPLPARARRPVRFDDRYVDTPVYRRDGLAPRERRPGPALVVERQTTTVVAPEARFGVDSFGNLRIDLDGGGR